MAEDLIHLLPDSVANQIAAGEVVQRPASVVKELVENSIDSGATSISVEISSGGIEKIKVTDNGCGMTKENLEKAETVCGGVLAAIAVYIGKTRLIDNFMTD